MIEHDANLQKLYERCRDKHIKINDEKTDMRKSEITFMGHRLTKEGIQADPTKVTAIRDMPSPTDVHAGLEIDREKVKTNRYSVKKMRNFDIDTLPKK